MLIDVSRKVYLQSKGDVTVLLDVSCMFEAVALHPIYNMNILHLYMAFREFSGKKGEGETACLNVPKQIEIYLKF